MSQQAEAIAATALREWLLLKLPSKINDLNIIRKASIKCPRLGPFTFANGYFSFKSTNVSAPIDVGPLNGSMTDSDIVSEINGYYGGGLATLDSEGRWQITSPNSPTENNPSHVSVGPVAGQASALVAMGWTTGGQEEWRAALIEPTANTIFDGRPIEPDFGAGMLIMIDDRRSSRADIRKDVFDVELDITILVQDVSIGASRSRDHIQSTVRAVREVLSQDRGRMLGRESRGDVVRAHEISCEIAGAPFQIGGIESPNSLFDAATMTLGVTVYERPDAT